MNSECQSNHVEIVPSDLLEVPEKAFQLLDLYTEYEENIPRENKKNIRKIVFDFLGEKTANHNFQKEYNEEFLGKYLAQMNTVEIKFLVLQISIECVHKRAKENLRGLKKKITSDGKNKAPVKKYQNIQEYIRNKLGDSEHIGNPEKSLQLFDQYAQENKYIPNINSQKIRERAFYVWWDYTAHINFQGKYSERIFGEHLALMTAENIKKFMYYVADDFYRYGLEEPAPTISKKGEKQKSDRIEETMIKNPVVLEPSNEKNEDLEFIKKEDNPQKVENKNTKDTFQEFRQILEKKGIQYKKQESIQDINGENITYYQLVLPFNQQKVEYTKKGRKVILEYRDENNNRVISKPLSIKRVTSLIQNISISNPVLKIDSQEQVNTSGNLFTSSLKQLRFFAQKRAIRKYSNIGKMIPNNLFDISFFKNGQIMKVSCKNTSYSFFIKKKNGLKDGYIIQATQKGNNFDFKNQGREMESIKIVHIMNHFAH